MRVLPVFCVVGLAVAGLRVFTEAQEYWGGYPGYSGASTAAESAAHGVSDVVQAAGAANLMNSEAAKNYEAARSQYIDNRLKGTKTYFEMKQYNKDYRDANKARSSHFRTAVPTGQGCHAQDADSRASSIR